MEKLSHLTNEELVYDFCIRLEDLRGYSFNTIDKYERYTNKFLLKIKKHITRITLKEIENYVRQLNKSDFSSQTINIHIASIRKFLQYCEYHDLSVINYKKIFYAKKIPSTPQFCEISEIKDFIKKAKEEEKQIIGLRNEVMIRMLFYTGLRISELLQINITDIKKDYSITIVGKGKKKRIVYINKEIMHLIRRYKKLRGGGDPLLVSHSRNSTGSRLNRNSASSIIKEYRKELKISKKITPHSLRHSAATLLLRAGENIKTIQQLLGHKHITTTQTYLHITNNEIKNTQAKLILA